MPPEPQQGNTTKKHNQETQPGNSARQNNGFQLSEYLVTFIYISKLFEVYHPDTIKLFLSDSAVTNQWSGDRKYILPLQKLSFGY